MESDARPAGVQPNMEAKLLTVIGLITLHAVCRIYVPNFYISKNDFTKLSAKTIARDL